MIIIFVTVAVVVGPVAVETWWRSYPGSCSHVTSHGAVERYVILSSSSSISGVGALMGRIQNVSYSDFKQKNISGKYHILSYKKDKN